MKKFVMMLMLAVFSLGAYAQTQQGQSAVGFNIGYGFDSKNATLGVDDRYYHGCGTFEPVSYLFRKE